MRGSRIALVGGIIRHTSGDLPNKFSLNAAGKMEFRWREVDLKSSEFNLHGSCDPFQ